MHSSIPVGPCWITTTILGLFQIISRRLHIIKWACDSAATDKKTKRNKAACNLRLFTALLIIAIIHTTTPHCLTQELSGVGQINNTEEVIVPTFRLIGGEEVNNDKSDSESNFIGGWQFPWEWWSQVSYNATNGFTGRDVFCSGVIVGPRTVLTVAHCLVNATRISLRYGSLLASSGGDVFITRDYLMHPSFSPATLVNDIALIRLPRQSSAFFKSAFRIALPNTQRAQIPWYNLYGYSYEVTGWGRTNLTDPDLSERLRFITVQIVPLAQCKRLYRENTEPSQVKRVMTRFRNAATLPPDPPAPQIFCASSPGKAICLGDSGGPLFTLAWTGSRSNQRSSGGDADQPTPILLGLASETLSCGLFGVPDIYTRVDIYERWIRQNLR